MFDNGSQADGEQLFDTTESDTDADGESTTTEQATESSGEEIEDNGESKSKGEAEREKQVEVWARRVASGEVDINDLPPSVKWVKARLLERQDAEKKVPELEKLVELKWKEREAEAKFVSLKESLKHQKLKSTQRTELATEFKELRESGLTKDKALAKAMRIVGIELDQETASEDLRSAMRPPAVGTKVKEANDPLSDIEGFKALKPEERIKRLEELRRK